MMILREIFSENQKIVNFVEIMVTASSGLPAF